MWMRFFGIVLLLCAVARAEDLLLLSVKSLNPGQDTPCKVGGFLSLPEGRCRDAGHFRVHDGEARRCPADFFPTARWPDGSIRFLSMKAVTADQSSKPVLQLIEAGSGSSPPWSITCKQPGGFAPVEVDTGPMRIRFSPLGTSWIQGLWLDQEEVLDSDDALTVKAILSGKTYTSLPPRRIVIDSGRAECTVSISSRTAARGVEAGPEFELRFRLHPGSTRIFCTAVVSGGQLEGYSDGIMICFKPNSLKEKNRLILLAGGPGKEGSMACSLPAELLSENRCLFYREHGRARPFLNAESAGLSLFHRNQASSSVYLPYFRMLHPWCAGCNSAEGLWISLLSKGFYWERGFTCERDFFFHVHAGMPLRKLPSVQSVSKGCAGFGLSDEMACRKFPFAPPGKGLGKDKTAQLLKKVSRKLINGLKKEREQWDGYRDFGDYRMPYGRFANCEFDPVYGFLKRFLVFGEIDDLLQAETMLCHWLRFDCAGKCTDPGLQGLPWMHGEEHASGEVELGHMWIDGALLYFLITHDLESRFASHVIGRYIAEALPDENAPCLERCAAWSLMALTALVDAGFEEYVDAMNRYAALISARQADEGYFRFDRVRDEDCEYYMATPWITGGITLEALYRHYSLTGDSTSRQALLKGGRWLMSRARDRVTGKWGTHVRYGVKNKARTRDRAKPVSGEDLALVALGLARAGGISRDRRMLKLARSTLHTGLRDLSRSDTEYPGRAFSLVMRAAPDVLMATRGL